MLIKPLNSLAYFRRILSQMPYSLQCRFWQRCRSSTRLPLQMSRPCWLQYCQIASCTNRGKQSREGAIERTGVDFSGNAGNDIGAAAWAVAARAVRMVCLEPAQDPGPVQKVMDQGIDRDQLHTDFEPPGANISGADQNAGQSHCQHLVGNAVDVAQWLNQSIARFGPGVWRSLIARLVQPVIDPANQIAVSTVANEQVETVGKLV